MEKGSSHICEIYIIFCLKSIIEFIYHLKTKISYYRLYLLFYTFLYFFMAKKGKGKKPIIALKSTGLNENGKPTGHFYIKQKNPKSLYTIELRKYDPKLRKHVLYIDDKKKTLKFS